MSAVLVPFESAFRYTFCTHVVQLKGATVRPGAILDFVHAPENGCRGRWSIGYDQTVFFEDSATAMMVKLRFG